MKANRMLGAAGRLRRPVTVRTTIAAATLTGVMFLGAPTVSVAACSPQFTKVSDSSVSNPANSVIWAMQEYKGLLYIGTSNRITGTEIHRYDGESWEQVIDAGFGNPNNEGLRHMAEYKGMLYAGTVNAVTGAEIWRTEDGFNWEKVMTGGFGKTSIDTVRSLNTFKGYLYAGASDAGDNDNPGQLRRTTDGVNWEPVQVSGFGDDFNDSFHRMEKFKGYLYVLVRHTVEGPPEIWRTDDGVNFRQVVGAKSATPPGFGIPTLQVFYDLRVFKDHIYVGTGDLFGFSLHRSADGINWETIGTDGMGWPGNGEQDTSNLGNLFTWRFEVFEDALWVGIFNYQGARLWKSETGDPGVENWIEMVGPTSPFLPEGFGNPYNWGVRTLEEHNDSLYIGTAQCIVASCFDVITGAEVWEFSGEACEDEGASGNVFEVLFDNDGEEVGVTPSGTTSFSYKGSNWLGGIVGAPPSPALIATGTQGYKVVPNTRVTFDTPVDSVTFHFADDDPAVQSVALALDANNNVIAARASRNMTTPGDINNFVTLDPSAPISSVRFITSAPAPGSFFVVDNFFFEP